LTVSLIILSIIFANAGFIGCIFPVIPGPPLSYLALIIISYARDWEPFSLSFLIAMAILTIIIMIVEYLLPIIGASRYGASKISIYLSITGMILGIFILPPWGIFLGAFLGGFAGEILEGKKGKDALKIGWVIFVSNILSIGIKLSFSLAVIFLCIKGIF
jgi:uncharacterized protein YqgC (DUF456 family)